MAQGGPGRFSLAGLRRTADRAKVIARRGGIPARPDPNRGRGQAPHQSARSASRHIDAAARMRLARQKSYFSANCMMRGAPAVRIRPKFELLRAATGALKLA